MKFVFLLLFLLLSTEAGAQPANQNGTADPDAIRRCRSYAECTLVWGGCSDVAINKKYVSQFQASSACQQSSAHNPKAVPTCLEGLCIVSAPDEKK
jgi:hypothetical protein